MLRSLREPGGLLTNVPNTSKELRLLLDHGPTNAARHSAIGLVGVRNDHSILANRSQAEAIASCSASSRRCRGTGVGARFFQYGADVRSASVQQYARVSADDVTSPGAPAVASLVLTQPGSTAADAIVGSRRPQARARATSQALLSAYACLGSCWRPSTSGFGRPELAVPEPSQSRRPCRFAASR